jgi:predicted transcriptional regulator
MVNNRTIEGFKRFKCSKCEHNFFEMFIFDEDWSILKCEFCHNIESTSVNIPIKTILKIFFNNNKNKYTNKYIANSLRYNERSISKVLLQLCNDGFICRKKELKSYVYYKK